MKLESQLGNSEHKEGLFYIVVSAIIVNSLGEILITKRAVDRDHRPGEWELVSGRVDAGEDDATEALSREVKEEVGLRLTSAIPYRTFYFTRSNSNTPHFGINFYCHYDENDNVKLDLNEQDDSKWVSPKIALTYIVDPNVQEAITEYQNFIQHYH